MAVPFPPLGAIVELQGRPCRQYSCAKKRSFLATSCCCTTSCSISTRLRSEELISAIKAPSTHRERG
jgi:hypothetical protein